MNDLVRVEPIALFPTQGGCALFLGDGEKEIVFYIEPGLGMSINSVLGKERPPRPLSHDLFTCTLQALGGRVTKVIIVDVQGEVFYARLWIEAENEIMERKIIEVDSRPSDAIAMAVRAEAPIYFIRAIWEKLEDMSGVLKKMRDAQQE